MKKIKKVEIKENQNEEIDERIFSDHLPTITLESIMGLIGKVGELGAKKLRCIEITPGKEEVAMQLLNIISVECSSSIGHPTIPQGTVTRVAINVSDDPQFECQTVAHFNEIIAILKEKVDEQSRKNVVVTVSFKSSLDPKKPHEKVYKNTRYFYDDELDVVYFAVGYPTTSYIQNFVANNPDVATTSELICYKTAKNSVEKDSIAKL